MEQKIITFLKIVSKLIILSLMLALVISIFLGTVNLFITLFDSIVYEKPHYLFNVKDLYPVFNLILIIIVGLELLKSMHYIADHDKLPVKTILLIAIIALANKAITLDIKSVGFDDMAGMAVLILAMAL